MKKRLLLILAVGIAFSPSVFAMSVVGPIVRSNDAGTAGAAFCKAGMELKSYASADSDEGSKGESRQAAAGQSSAGDGS
jgi:hypothetical protein